MAPAAPARAAVCPECGSPEQRELRSTSVGYPPSMPKLAHIGEKLSDFEPTLVEVGERSRASVAVVLRERDDSTELLFIERARHEGDPWSGHMAFPGGRLEPEDRNGRAAAERETFEEVGLSLAGSRCLGRLDDLEGRPARAGGGLVVSAYVYQFEAEIDLVPNREVQQAFWFPVASLLHPERQVVYPHAKYDGKHLPGILVGVPDRHIVWGLTYRFVDVMMAAVGKPLPNRWVDLR
jgi:8-oxo-dGTP pyrophosphatase MutT (NUDIX family)